MITLDKLTVTVGAKLFNQHTQKLIRIQAQNLIVKTKSPAKPTSQTNLQWDEPIELPLVYNQPMPFEIYDKHQFGYNPEEIKSVMHGTMVFTQGNDKFNNFEVFDSNDKKMGYFSVNIKNKPTKAVTIEKSQPNQSTASPPKRKIVDQTQLVIISSIVVNLPSIKAKRGFALISIGGNDTRTSPVKSKSGELVFIQKYQLDKHPEINEGLIEIYSCGTDELDQKIASGGFKIEKKIDRKIRFYDGQNHQIGQGFIDGKVQLKTQALANKMFASIIRQGIHKEFSPSESQGKTFKDLSRSLLSNSSFMRSNDLTLSRSTKKMSILNHNNNIKFPQQKRFFTSRDPANNKCSYLKESQRSFEFREKNVDKYYKGASIGYGGKADFTHAKKDLPSVGKYHLPSIWDRY